MDLISMRIRLAIKFTSRLGCELIYDALRRQLDRCKEQNREACKRILLAPPCVRNEMRK